MSIVERIANRIANIVYTKFISALRKTSADYCISKPTTAAELIEQLKEVPPDSVVQIAKGAFLVGHYTHLEVKEVFGKDDAKEPSVILYPVWYSSALTKGVDYE